MSELWKRTGTALAEDLRGRRVSALEAVDASLDRIAALDPTLHAFITVDGERARDRARELDGLDRPAGPLHGVPIAIKDLTDTAGLRTTNGSAVLRDNVPKTDDIVVARLKAAGAIVVGKTSTPEFGYGARCANPIVGTTNNPFDIERNSAGSSGGAAVAAATGMVTLAHGTDFAGSVRTPASFCGVASIRPTPGLVPSPGRALGGDTLATHGVIARDVDDCLLMLRAMAGPHKYDITSRWVPPLGDARMPGAPRIAASADLGVAPVANAVREAFGPVAEAMARVGSLTWAHPDCSGVNEAFHTLRAAHIWHRFGKIYETHHDALTPTVQWAVPRGRDITARDYLDAEATRTAVYRRFMDFFERFDVLVVPAAAVLPFRNDAGEVTEIDGKPLATIIDYLAVTSIISFVALPVVTLPASQVNGLPFGIQLIGRPGEDSALADFAKRCERELGFVHHWPPGLGTAAAR